MSVHDQVVDLARGAEPVALEWFGTSLRVHVPVPETLQYVADHHRVGPPTVKAPPYRSAALFAVAAPNILDELRDQAARRTVSRRESFKGVWYAYWETADGATMVVDETHAYQHALLTRDFTSWAVVGERPEDLGLVVARTIRELVREDLLAMGAVTFHASAAELPDGTGVLLTGGSGAGKTTTAVRIGCSGGRVIGTDRSFLLRHAGEWLVVGLPETTRLGLGGARTLGLLGLVEGRVLSREQTLLARAGASGKEAKLTLSNGEMTELLNCGYTPAATADSIVVLSGSPLTSATRMEDLAPAEAHRALREHLLAPDPDYRVRWLSPDPAQEDAGSATAELSALLTRQPARRLTWNPQLHCDERVVPLLTARTDMAPSAAAHRPDRNSGKEVIR
ncbi:hypothetical protein [Streptomyces sp. FxanaA7]|uniref:hypothetical protein n=1 Tax=Streptomyces sp. FxanaA7 TaxID=1265492 RepID=UPI0005EFC528|nr:hypothetical protein [Streptomyces sp. FxanaA7]